MRDLTPVSPKASGQAVMSFRGTLHASSAREYAALQPSPSSRTTFSSHAASMSRQNRMYASQQTGLNQYAVRIR